MPMAAYFPVNPVRGYLQELDVPDTTAAEHPLIKVGLMTMWDSPHERMIGVPSSNLDRNPMVTVAV